MLCRVVPPFFMSFFFAKTDQDSLIAMTVIVFSPIF